MIRRHSSLVPRLSILRLSILTMSYYLLTLNSFAAAPADLADPDPAARDAARRTLLTTATPADIPALAALLANPDASDAAIFLLESLADPAADAALRDALKKTAAAKDSIALLQALARRADPQSEPLAASLAAAPDPAVATAAVRLLAMLATPSAIQTVAGLLDGPAAADGLLTAAGRLVQRGETAKAIPLYTRVQKAAAAPEHLRLAALSGLLHADPALGPDILPGVLADPSPVWSGTAARLAALLPDKPLNRLARAKLGPAAKLVFIDALAAAGNRAGAPFVRECLADPATKAAAAAALGTLGDASDASSLLALLGHPDPALADTARKSLITLADPKADAIVLNTLKSRKRLPDPAALISVAAARGITAASPLIAPYLKNESPDTRAAALNALAAVGAAAEAAAVVSAVSAAQSPDEARALDKALARFARDFPAETSAAIEAPATPALLAALALASQPDGLAKLAAKLPDEETLRALANVWKTPDAVPALFDQAATHAKNTLRIVALRGALRLLPLVDNPDDYAAFLAEANKLAARPEEKTLIAELPARAPQSWRSGIHFLPRRIGACRSEACCVADFNGDGKLDIAAGPYLYLAPDWKAVRIRNVSSNVGEDGKGYADDFCNLALDVNRDGKPDIVSGAWFAKTSRWFENTLSKSAADVWPEHLIETLGNHETGTLVDIDGDGKALEFFPDTHITVWYEIGKTPDGQPGFVKHTVSANKAALGTGVGDINGDGRPDVIRPSAWYEAPQDIRKDPWKEHPLSLGAKDGKTDHTANIIVTDINKDGLNDILTSSAHKHGIFWYEQQRGADGAVTWKQHTIDDTWSQAHYLAFADIDGDGNKEIITGKRFMAHNGSDPDETGTLGIYYYRFTPGPAPHFRKYTITYDEGIGAGSNIVPVDIDGDGDLDLVTTGKWGGPVLFENRLNEKIPDAERKAALAAKPVIPGPRPSDNLALAAYGAKASSDSELDGSAGCTAKLNDGAPAGANFAQTRWHSALTPMPHWAEIKLAKPAKICRVIAHFADPAGYATSFEIQVKKGNDYATVYAADNNRDAKTANVTFASVETDTVRFVFRKNASATYPNAAQLSELEIYAQ